MAKASEWTPLQGLRDFGLVIARKDGFVAAAWVVVYFLTQWVNAGTTMLFAPLIGAIAGVAIGWYLAEDAAEDAGFTGLSLWIILTIGCWAPMWIVEWILGAIMKHAAGWQMDFGRFMMLMTAMILGFASAIWRSSADE
jgi:hypothetical protein